MSISTTHLRLSKGGFTIVELLIVIVVIAILAAITIVAYNGIQKQAQISSVSDGLTQVKKSFTMWAITDGFTQWPDEPIYGGGPNLSNMIADNPGLRQNLQSVPKVIGVGTDEWFYDNDVEETGGTGVCGNMYNGANIVIRYITDRSIAEGVDKTLDKENVAGQNWNLCGRVKYDLTAGILFYSLGYTEDEVPN